MPRLFLHIWDGPQGWFEDDEGADYDSVEVARAEAVETVRAIVKNRALSGDLSVDGYVNIADANGTVLVHMPFASATSPPSIH